MPDTARHPAAAIAVIVQNGRLLLVRRHADDGAPPWVLPGGKLEPGEHPSEAAVREVLEETGLTVRPVRILGDRIHPDTAAHLTYVACDVLAGTAHVADPDELDAVAWAAARELAGFVTHGFYEPVEAYLRQVLTADGAGLALTGPHGRAAVREVPAVRRAPTSAHASAPLTCRVPGGAAFR